MTAPDFESIRPSVRPLENRIELVHPLTGEIVDIHNPEELGKAYLAASEQNETIRAFRALIAGALLGFVPKKNLTEHIECDSGTTVTVVRPGSTYKQDHLRSVWHQFSGEGAIRRMIVMCSYFNDVARLYENAEAPERVTVSFKHIKAASEAFEEYQQSGCMWRDKFMKVSQLSVNAGRMNKADRSTGTAIFKRVRDAILGARTEDHGAPRIKVRFPKETKDA